MQQQLKSRLQGPHKHCYAGMLAVGGAFLLSSFLSNTTEVVLGASAILGTLLYISKTYDPDDISEE